MLRICLVLLATLLIQASAHASADGLILRQIEHLGRTFHVATIDLRVASLDLYGQRPDGGNVANFTELAAYLDAQDRRLVMGTNGGIFKVSGRPVGLHIERGVETSAVEVADGFGNFYLKPNGVFWTDDRGAHVDVTEAWTGGEGVVRLATQSGPVLLVDGALHPAFQEQSLNLLPRSGVGVSDPHTVHLVMSQGSVRFWELATLFRDVLGCTDALYLDGVISQWVDPDHPPGPSVDGRFASMLVVTVPNTSEQLR